MTKPIRIGIVGVGGMGCVHYANYLRIPEVQVAAVCDVGERARSRGEEWKLPSFSSIREMCESCELDAVDICTPTFCHHDQVLEALRCNLPVIVEKPVALRYADACEMVAEADRRGLPLYVAQVLQFTKETAALKQVVKDGRYGKPIDAVFERLTACPQWAAGGWLFDKSKSGLLPYDLHIHDLDLMVSVFGEPEGFTANVAKNSLKGYPELIRVNYAYPGLQVVGEAAWLNASIPFTARWRVAFQKGALVCEGGKLLGYGADGTVTEFDTHDEVTVSTGINVPPCGWYYNELKHFAACLQKREGSPLVPKEQILTVMRLVEEIAHECE